MRMDKLRRTLSFRKRKDPEPESSKPHQWQDDEVKVRNGNCSFQVKYLGCLEVYESRGMQVCEDAVKTLKHRSKTGVSKAVRAILYVSGDGLRVVDQESKGLIVDQTIEKVSFCAPDRSHERGFAYICRDGTTRRWMCHGFMALRESGERLSHAVGCAFALCLERKLKRDKDCGVTANFAQDKTSFERLGSFRQASMTEKMVDPQSAIIQEPIPVLSVDTPHALPRPHASASMMQRQGSYRGFTQLNQTSPFKRTVSLRIGELPSTLQRQMRTQSDSIPPCNSSNGSHSNNGHNSSNGGISNGVYYSSSSSNGMAAAGATNGSNGHFDLESPTGSIISGASSVGAMSLPPGVGVTSGHSRAASMSGVIQSASKGGAQDLDLISNLCQKISTDLGALGADWESTSEILDVTQASRYPQAKFMNFDSASVPNISSESPTSSCASPPLPPNSSSALAQYRPSVSAAASAAARSSSNFNPSFSSAVQNQNVFFHSSSSSSSSASTVASACSTRPRPNAPFVSALSDKNRQITSHHSRTASLDISSSSSSFFPSGALPAAAAAAPTTAASAQMANGRHMTPSPNFAQPNQPPSNQPPPPPRSYVNGNNHHCHTNGGGGGGGQNGLYSSAATTNGTGSATNASSSQQTSSEYDPFDAQWALLGKSPFAPSSSSSSSSSRSPPASSSSNPSLPLAHNSNSIAQSSLTSSTLAPSLFASSSLASSSLASSSLASSSLASSSVLAPSSLASSSLAPSSLASSSQSSTNPFEVDTIHKTFEVRL